MARPATPAPEFSRPDDGSASEPSKFAEESRVADRSEVRSAVARFLVVGLIALVAVSVPVALWIGVQAEHHTLDDATLRTHQLADITVGPFLTDGLMAGDPGDLASLDARLEPWLADDSIVRVKVWNMHGQIVYSDASDLIGRSFPLPHLGEELVADGPERASLGRAKGLDHIHEAAAGALIEINVMSEDAAGRPVIVEAYFDDAAVQREQSSLLSEMIPVLLGALVVLQLAQLVPAVRLARRIQADEATRRRLLQHAIVASDLERQRIARELHDEVIQDLAGLSYAFEAEEMHGIPARRPLYSRARSILQRNLHTLRAMTTELYPPDLERLGLNEALLRLADQIAGHDIVIRVQLAEAQGLDRDRAVVLYRVARESLTNAVKHARADTIELTLVQDEESTTMSVHDDGRGFDPAAAPPEGHIGLRIMRDTIHVVGGSLSISSRIGDGTTVVVRIDRS